MNMICLLQLRIHHTKYKLFKVVAGQLELCWFCISFWTFHGLRIAMTSDFDRPSFNYITNFAMSQYGFPVWFRTHIDCGKNATIKFFSRNGIREEILINVMSSYIIDENMEVRAQREEDTFFGDNSRFDQQQFVLMTYQKKFNTFW